KIGTLFGWLSLLAAVIGIVIFYKPATTPEHPLVRLTILKNPAFVFFLFGFFVCQLLFLRISFVLPNFVQIVLGKNSFLAG
ncbi:MFS transporter, partial [Enterococcus faecalis]